MLLHNLHKMYPNSGHMGGSRRLKDPVDTLLLQFVINLFFIPKRNRLFQLSVGSYKVLLSDQVSLGGSLLLTNWRTIMMKSSVSSEGVTSKYTAQVTRHANKHPHLFAVPWPHSTVSGSNKSTPVKVNGGWYASSLALGSNPINCSKGLAFILWHLIQLLIVFFTRPLPPIIQDIVGSSHSLLSSTMSSRLVVVMNNQLAHVMALW